MAYLGTTQATSLSNPPICIGGAVGFGPASRIAGSSGVYQGNAFPSTAAYVVDNQLGQRLWMYHTTDMTSAPWNTAYFTDGGQMGMRPGDVMIIVSQGTTVTSSQYLRMAVIGSVSTSGAAQLSTNSLITCST